jgi:hypothetical protein
MWKEAFLSRDMPGEDGGKKEPVRIARGRAEV